MPPPFQLRDYRPGDAPQIAQTYFGAVRQLGPCRYSQAQVEAWAPVVPPAAGFAARATDGRTTLIAEVEAVLVARRDCQRRDVMLHDDRLERHGG